MWGEHTAATFIKHNFILKQQTQKHGNRRRKHWGYCGHQLRKQPAWGIVLKKKSLWCWQRQPFFKHTVMSLLQAQTAMTLLRDAKRLLYLRALVYESRERVEVTGHVASSLSLYLHICMLCYGNALNQGKKKNQGKISSVCREKRNNRRLSEPPFIIRGSLEPKLHPDYSGFLNLHLSEWYMDLYHEKMSSLERDCNSLSFY